MSKLVIEIDTSNAAFEEPNFYGEISACVEQVPIKLQHCNQGTIKDYNGNTVGNFELKKD